ncbi:Oidioi.mRNA.OKI2018_I69.PAR.g10262.t1.cds [Oikopleura dioica]|uniref:Oidioi.mRNA.OKI2018_I69.PAR.g10262.t1.cds n=1 Tax=Oikopleura dioica TaxID=34765 RepID=A0ABN7RTD5_OIKDI|nr:Oidioi.mRNA.OKI2018_I69.PAR.g10262.t1.cds [Oikopleura dioica]
MRKLKTKEKNCLKGLGAAILVIGILFAIWFTQFRTTICDPDPCLNRGLCDLANRNMSKIVAKCSCPDEFTEKPCKNNGFCSVNNKTYSFECACPNSHYGETCETSFCQPNPCESKGVCLVDEEKPGFVCDCVPGRHGKFCEIDVCNPNPCRNNGACKKTKEHEPRPEDEFTCECKTRFHGTLCEHERCSINPCKNGGKCHVYQNKEVCDCPDNTVGNFCEKKPCDGKPCKHGGICGTDKDKKTFKCKCPAGFHGKSCEKHRSIKVLTTTGMYDLNAVGKINQEGLSYPGKQIEEAIKDAGIAVFKNKAYFFGGHVDSIAILKLEGSQIKASGKKLKQSHKFSSGIQVDSEGDEGKFKVREYSSV